MALSTAYLCETYSARENLQIAEPVLRSFGKTSIFSGVISTLKCFEDGARMKTILAEPGEGRVLVVDGGGSHRCALLDGDLAKMAQEHGWQGVVVYGCVRNADVLSQIPIGVFALHAHPLLCHAKATGDRDVSVTFAGINFRKDHFLYADSDGIVVSDVRLS